MRQPDKAMIHSSRRDREVKAIAEVLAMIAAPELAPYRPRAGRETNEWLREESASEFSAALEKYYAAHTHRLINLPKKRMV